MDPYYNQTIYIVLSIAYRRENDLNNAVKAVSIVIVSFCIVKQGTSKVS
jgi:hypothetical protein